MICMAQEDVITENAWIVAVFGIFMIAALVGYALSLGMNGVIFGTGISGIYLVVGYCFAKRENKIKQEIERLIIKENDGQGEEGSL